MAWFQGRNMWADLGSDMGRVVKGVPPVMHNDGQGSGGSTTPQPVSRNHPINTPVDQYVGILPPKTVDTLQNAFQLGPNHSRPHGVYHGPPWPAADAGVLEWLYTGVVWTGGYAVFTYADFVEEWRDWDGSLLGIFEPHRLLRTFITVAVTIGLTYVLPMIDVLIRLTERFYNFVVTVFGWTGEALERVQLAWQRWMGYMRQLRRRWG